ATYNGHLQESIRRFRRHNQDLNYIYEQGYNFTGEISNDVHRDGWESEKVEQRSENKEYSKDIEYDKLDEKSNLEGSESRKADRNVYVDRKTIFNEESEKIIYKIKEFVSDKGILNTNNDSNRDKEANRKSGT
ncbi:19758_t:CDS:2, partial [Racocetra persica]